MILKQQNKFSLIKKILLFVGIFLLFGSNSYGAVSYNISPTGFSLTSPVDFYVAFDEWSETECEFYNATEWGIGVQRVGGDVFYSEFVDFTSQDEIFVMDLPVGFDYTGVAFSCLSEGTTPMLATFWLEYDEGNAIFETIESPTYERNPTGFSITSPVDFTISFDDPNSTACPYYNSSVWGVGVVMSDYSFYYSDFLPLTTHSATFTMDLPVGFECLGVAISCLENDIEPILDVALEGGAGVRPFEIVEGEEPTIPVITIPANFSTSTLAYAGALFTDLTPVIILAIGLPVGFWVIKKVISMVKPR